MASIEIYTQVTCLYYHRDKVLFTRKQVPFQEIPINDDVDLREEIIKPSIRTTVPQIFIDGRYAVGCNDLHAPDACSDVNSLLK